MSEGQNLMSTRKERKNVKNRSGIEMRTKSKKAFMVYGWHCRRQLCNITTRMETKTWKKRNKKRSSQWPSIESMKIRAFAARRTSDVVHRTSYIVYVIVYSCMRLIKLYFSERESFTNHVTIMLPTERWMRNKIRDSDTKCLRVWMHGCMSFVCFQSSKQYFTILCLLYTILCVWFRKGAKIVAAADDQQTRTKRK